MTQAHSLALHLLRIPLEGLRIHAVADQSVLKEVWRHHRRTADSLVQLVDRWSPLDLGAPRQADRIKEAGIDAVVNGLIVDRCEELVRHRVELDLPPAFDTPEQLLAFCRGYALAHGTERRRLLTPGPPNPSSLEADADGWMLVQLGRVLPEASEFSGIDDCALWLEGLALRRVELHVERGAAHARTASWDAPLLDEADEVRALESALRIGLEALWDGEDALDVERAEWEHALRQRAEVLVAARTLDAAEGILEPLGAWIPGVAPVLPAPDRLVALLQAERDLRALARLTRSIALSGHAESEENAGQLTSLLSPMERRHRSVEPAVFRAVRENIPRLHHEETVGDMIPLLRTLMAAVVNGQRGGA